MAQKKIEVLKPFKHKGEPVKVGDRFKVSESVAQWLEDRKLARIVKTKAAPNAVESTSEPLEE